MNLDLTKPDTIAAAASERADVNLLINNLTRQVKAGLSDEVGAYLDFDPQRALAAVG